MGAAAVAVGVGVTGIDGDGRIEVGDGGRIVAPRVILQAAIIPGERHLRIEAYGAGVIRYRTVALAQSGMGDAAIVVGIGEFRVELDRLVVVRDRPAGVATVVAPCG